MELGGWMNMIYKICQWLSRLAYLNLLWLLFMFLGVLVVGAAPSTAAMFTIIRKWVRGQYNVPIFRLFWETYQAEFKKANYLGAFIMMSLLLFWLSWHLISSLEGTLVPIMMGVYLGIMALWLVIMLYLFPVFVHYEGKALQSVKKAFIIGISYPFYTIRMIMAVAAALLVGMIFPGAGLLLTGSGIGFVLMYLANKVFRDIHERSGIQDVSL
ncbi:MAG TPA: DUF624 domain-containing protein [Candidatus Bathyarchaeia archaeon]|nr:DUF624 domain-containing protein [Candidatus Bathyarchaeia archaeon]